MKRHKMGKHKSKKLFSRSASYIHPKNSLNSSAPMRGGIRL